MIFQLIESMEDNLQIEGKKILIGVSGGINSAAVLCWLAKYCTQKPSELHLFYADFEEHSPGTFDFVQAQFEYAKKHFKNVFCTITKNSINKFCKKIKSVPPPKDSPCTRLLKIEPISVYMYENNIDFDLVGYVREEKGRIERQNKRNDKRKIHPLKHVSDSDCFDIVLQEIGFYPEIYKIKWSDKRIKKAILTGELSFLEENQLNIIKKYSSRGYGYKKQRRVFKHNNCLPCKNMHLWELAMIKIFFPEYFNQAIATTEEIKAIRKATNMKEKEVYFGRLEQYSEIPSTCTYCAID